MLTVGQEHHDPMEIHVGGGLRAITFSADGEYVFTGGRGRVRVWRVKDGKQMATMKADGVLCLAGSNDGRWIAAGTSLGDVLVWDAKTYKEVFVHKEDDWDINGVDFSPDSTRLVSASDNYSAIVWDTASATRERVQTLPHEDKVFAAKYSPHGDRIATATSRSVRVYDGNVGLVLVDINATVTQWYNTGLLWFNNHLLVISDGQIKQFKASTGSAVSEWPIPDTDQFSCIALPKHGEFIACSTQRTVTLWDTATHTRVGLIQHPQEIRSIVLSPDDLFIAISGRDGKIIIQSLSRIIVSNMARRNCDTSLLALIMVTYGAQSICLIYSPPSRNQTLRLTTLCSILGSTVNSRTQKHY